MGVSPRSDGGRQRKEGEGEICGHDDGEETEDKKRKINSEDEKRPQDKLWWLK